MTSPIVRRVAAIAGLAVAVAAGDVRAGVM